MNWAHVHLLLNHGPVIGMIIAAPLLGWGLYRHSDEVVRAAFIMITVLAVVAIGVYLTGEPAEAVVEDLPDVLESAIELHEKLALIAVTELFILGIITLVGLIRSRGRAISSRLALVVFAMSIVSAAAFGATAYFGGMIRHSEIRNDDSATGFSPRFIEGAGQ